MILDVPDAASMRALGRRLGKALLQAGSAPAVIALNGELGAGKTTFVSGVLAETGFGGPVRSPTYTLIEPYEVGERVFYHLDLYRLSGPGDLEGLGLRDLHVPGSVLLVEWAERGGTALPAADLLLELRYADAARGMDSPRSVEVSAKSDTGRALLAGLAQGSAS